MEEWRDVVGYEGLYQVSDCGSVRNAKSGRALKPYPNKFGYLLVCLYSGNGRERHQVHRLVCDAFIPQDADSPQVNHKDENKKNNMLENLERCTAKYNMNYGTGRERTVQKIRKPVVQISHNGTIVAHYASAREAHSLGGFCYKHISDCCIGRRKSHAGYMWRFA